MNVKIRIAEGFEVITRMWETLDAVGIETHLNTCMYRSDECGENEAFGGGLNFAHSHPNKKAVETVVRVAKYYEKLVTEAGCRLSITNNRYVTSVNVFTSK